MWSADFTLIMQILFEQSFSCAIYFISIQIWHLIYILHHVAICKTQIKVYKSIFGKTQGNGDLGISCDKFFKNLFALRPCF